MKELSKRCQSLVGLIGCWYIWFGRFSYIAHRYRKSILIIEIYSIDFLAPETVINSQTTYPIWQMSVPSGYSEEWAIIGMFTIRCISIQLWGITCNKHCCETFIQIAWVQFPIVMNQSSGYNPICCPANSAELRCFEFPCQVWLDNVACRAWPRIPDVTILM